MGILFSPGVMIQKRFILKVGLTHLLETRNLLLFDVKMLDRISVWDIQNMQPLRSYDSMLLTIRDLTEDKDS